jgi:hypothetical protein
MTSYKSSKLQIIDILADLSTPIHFTFGLWTSPNHRALLGIISHCISQSGILQYTVLGLWRFKVRNTGEHQAESFWAVAQEYKIEQNIAYFTLDKASNNKTVMKCISVKLRELDIEFDPVHHRLWCHGYIIKLVVKACLWSEEPGAFELEVESLWN